VAVDLSDGTRVEAAWAYSTLPSARSVLGVALTVAVAADAGTAAKAR